MTSWSARTLRRCADQGALDASRSNVSLNGSDTDAKALRCLRLVSSVELQGGFDDLTNQDIETLVEGKRDLARRRLRVGSSDIHRLGRSDALRQVGDAYLSTIAEEAKGFEYIAELPHVAGQSCCKSSAFACRVNLGGRTPCRLAS